jgi:catechol 2,3-dioxygenase-like lactoylglutathione lyase family enzyme
MTDYSDVAAYRAQVSPRRLDLTTLVCADYDEAVDFFVTKLGFRLSEDTQLGNGKRWVVVSPGVDGTGLLLARASTDEQRHRVGDQTGGRVGFFLSTDDFEQDHDRFKQAGIDFLEAPRTETYGQVAVFADLYGNKWDLIGRTPGSA